MSKFRQGDKVYCPGLAKKPFLTYTKKDVNGVFIRFRGTEYWFTLDGLPERSPETTFPRLSLPAIFKATESNRMNLCDLYDMEFEESVDISIYALNVSDFGRATTDWVFHSQEGYYDWHSPSEELIPSIDTLRHYDILLSPFTGYLKSIDVNTDTSIICVAKESIDKWCNLK